MSQPWEKVAEGLPAELRDQFRKTMEEMGASETYAAPSGYREVRRRAAVHGAFDPAELTSEKAVLEQLYDETTVTVEAGRRLWLLNPGPRREELQQIRPDELKALLPSASSDPLTATLGDYLKGTAKPLQEQTAEQLLKTAVVSEWLEGTPFAAPSPRDVEARLGFEQLLRPFHELLRDGFSGRGDDLATLAEFVGAKPPPDWKYAGMRVLSTLLKRLSGPSADRPFVVHSPGGMGKSTLMAKFLLEHAKQEPTARFPFAYLDFDRASLRPKQPLSLLNEIAKQVGHQFPAVRGALDVLGAQQREQLRRFAVDQRGDSRVLEDSCRALRDAVSSVVGAGRPFLLVLDTFEEVQQSDEQGTADTVTFLRVLSDHGRWEPLRVVIAGRAPLGKSVAAAGEHPLGPFDEDAAVDLLARSIPGSVPRPLLVEVHKRVGGSPLALKLAASLLKAAQAQSLQHVQQTVQSFAALDRPLIDRVMNRWDSVHISAQLYERILEHIKDDDPDLKKLAHPGLVLRRITPGLIQGVLAEACKLGAVDAVRADALFDRLALQVSLVAKEGRVLTHRADVRSLMLGLIAKDMEAREAGSFAKLNRAAADFHEKDDPAEALYHCLLGGDVARATAMWTPALGAQLKVALEELPEASQVLVKAKRVEFLTVEEIALLTPATWTAYAEQRVAKLLADQRPVPALELLSRRKLEAASMGISRLRAAALHDSGDLPKAAEAYHRASELPGTVHEKSQLFREFGGLLLKLEDKRALPVFEEALRLSWDTNEPIAQLEALVGRVGAMACEGIADRSKASTEMFELANRLGASAGGQAPDLLRRAVLFADRSMRGFTPVRFTYLQYLRAVPIRALNAPEREVVRKLLQGASEFERLQGWLAGLDVVTSDPRTHLSDGSSGPAVEELQRMLQVAGHFSGFVDAVYGPQTRDAVTAFQKAKGVGVDGVVGPETRAALYQLPQGHLLAPAEELNRFLMTVLDAAPAPVIPTALSLLIHRHPDWRLPAQQVVLAAKPGHQRSVAARFLETRRFETYVNSSPLEQVRRLVDQADDDGRLLALLDALVPDHALTAAFRGWTRFLQSLVA